MRSLFEFNSGHQPFLAPLGPRRRLPSLSRETFERLPPAAAPLAVTLIGGLALVVVLGWFLSRGANGTPPPPQTAALVETAAPVEASSAAAAAEPATVPEDDAAPAEETAAAAEPAAEAAMPAIEPEPAPEFSTLDPLIEPLPDPGATAAIPRALPGLDAPAPDVAVAETEAETEALEALQRMEIEEDLGVAPDDPVEDPTVPSNEETAAIAPEQTVPMRAATTTQYVNMRAGPDDDAQVLMVVPARASIEAEADCGWCAVAYDGRSGYIYRSFIRYAD